MESEQAALLKTPDMQEWEIRGLFGGGIVEGQNNSLGREKEQHEAN